MTKKRASLAGRGVEILFGGGPAERSPLASTEDRSSRPRAAASTDEDQPSVHVEETMAAEWEAMLESEAAAATADTNTSGFTAEDGRPDWPVATVEEPADSGAWPETESPPAVQPAAPDQPPTALPVADEPSLPPLATTPAQPAGEEPTSEVGTPPAPSYVEPSEPYGQPSAPSPSAAMPSAAGSTERPYLDGALYETATEKPPEERLAPSDGFEVPMLVPDHLAEYETDQPSRIRDEQEILDYVGLKQRQALWDEANGLYETVPEILSTDEQQGDALLLLQEAQDILMERPRQFDVAKYKVGQVNSIVRRRTNITKWTNTYGWGAFLYEALWFLVLIVAVFGSSAVVNWIVEASGVLVNVSAASIAALWTTMAWGGMGGVVGAYYSLYWHAAKVKDFDKQYMMWYIVQPVIGLLIGALVHLIIGSGLLTAREPSSEGQVVASLFPATVAFIASFRQRFILEIIDRIIQLITPQSK